MGRKPLASARTASRSAAAAAHVLSQCLRAAALYLGSDSLFHGRISVPVFAAATHAAVAATLAAAYRPPLAAALANAHALLLSGAACAASLCLWSLGLARCGPLRTTLLDYSELVVANVLAALSGRPVRQRGWRRGLLTLLLAYAALLLTHGMHHRDGGGGEAERFFEPESGVYDSARSLLDSASGEAALAAAAAINALRRSASLEAEDGVLSSSQRSSGHVLRCIRPYSAVFTVFAPLAFTRCSEYTARDRSSRPEVGVHTKAQPRA